MNVSQVIPLWIYLFICGNHTIIHKQLHSECHCNVINKPSSACSTLLKQITKYLLHPPGFPQLHNLQNYLLSILVTFLTICLSTMSSHRKMCLDKNAINSRNKQSGTNICSIDICWTKRENRNESYLWVALYESGKMSKLLKNKRT
jgi:hypothetical protein